MRATDLAAFVKGMAPAIRDAIAVAVAEVETRYLEEVKALRLELDGLKGITAIPGPPGPKGDAGRDGADGAPGAPGRDGLDGKDGVPGIDGVAGAPGRDGLDGKDGLAGRDGRDGLPGLQGEKGLDGINGKDGKDGIDGKDGLGFEDLDVVYDGERTMTLTFQRGEQMKAFSFTMPIVLDRGVFVPGKTYHVGDGVTWGGSFHIAQKETSAKPGEASEASRAWRLAVKRGGDGKQGPKGDPGDRGPKGDAGPQGRSGY